MGGGPDVMDSAKLPQVICSGGPHEIGCQHGAQAAPQIAHSISFYKAYFQQTSQLSWPDAIDIVRKFVPALLQECPRLVLEMQAIAEGYNSVFREAKITFDDILALNCRTEIAMGLMTDGCTAFSTNTASTTILAQNWDWVPVQSKSLIVLKIDQPSCPSIAMVTEAGIIGKIGLNSAGIGVTLNAIRAKGIAHSKLPVHIALRYILDHGDPSNAVQQVLRSGVAASCHILVAHPAGQWGLECSHNTITVLQPDAHGYLAHTNHFCDGHLGRSLELRDSRPRLARIRKLLSESKLNHSSTSQDPASSRITVQAEPTPYRVQEDLKVAAHLLEDENGLPGAINRHADGAESDMQTLFRIVMWLQGRRAWVTIGRPTEGGEVIELSLPAVV